MRERRTAEFIEQLAADGVQITGGDDNVVLISLRNLALANGSRERGQAALYSALNTLRAVRIDIEPQDVHYIFGQNVISQAIARGLESGIPGLVSLLTSVEPDELYDRLEAASAFIFNDHAPDNQQVRDYLERGAEQDLYNSGLTAAPIRYVDPPDPYAAKPNTFWEPDEVKPWKSPFDFDGEV